MDGKNKNYYEILEIGPDATPQTIENAYIRARNAYSGDSVALYSLMTKEECDSILAQIEEAYAIIGFPEKRREYDRVKGFNQNSQPQPQVNTAPVLQTKEHFLDSVQYDDFSSNLIEAKVSKLTAQKKFGLEFNENSEMDRRISECTDFTGSFLKEIREYKNVSLERMAEMTRISKTQITSIENDDFKKIPSEVYTRGFAYQYAKVLKLNPDEVANSYLLHFKKIKNQK